MNISLSTAQELEKKLGERYFYRQAIYRLAEENAISTYQINDVMYLSSEEVQTASLKRLAEKIHRRFPDFHYLPLRVKFSEVNKVISVYGFDNDFKVKINTEKETEENLLNKIEKVRKGVNKMPDMPVNPPGDRPAPPLPPKPGPHPHHEGPEKHHHDVTEALRRIEDGLRRIEDKLK